MGIYIGSGLANVLGGVVVGAVSEAATWQVPLIGAIRPWQVVFFLVGLPGALFAAMLWTVREPARRGARGALLQVTARPGVPLREVVAYLKLNWVTFACHNLGYALLSFSSYGSSSWIPTFLQRSYGMSARASGVAYGLIIMTAGTLGIVFGGRLADWLWNRGYRDAKMRAGLIASLVWLPTGIGYVFAPDGRTALLLLVPTVFAASMPFGAAAAAIQEMMPNAMRGQASAIYLFVVNLIGLGLGPTAVALCTDYVFRDDLDLRYSLALVATVAHLASTAFLWLGLKPFRESLARVEA
jgi:MFS family permease